MKGLFVCFEGIDGSGKTTQVRLLKKDLEGMGRACVVLSYPDHSSPYGKIIESYLHKSIDMSAEELFLVFLADMVRDAGIIRKSLKRGRVVICDRYLYSTIAYQCAAGFDYKKAKMFEDAISLPLPSCLFYIDMPPELTYERKMGQKGKADRNESDAIYMKDVRSYYKKLLDEKYTDVRCIKIDGTGSVDGIHGVVMRSVKAMLP